MMMRKYIIALPGGRMPERFYVAPSSILRINLRAHQINHEKGN
jgi:hypothetical protein